MGTYLASDSALACPGAVPCAGSGSTGSRVSCGSRGTPNARCYSGLRHLPAPPSPREATLVPGLNGQPASFAAGPRGAETVSNCSAVTWSPRAEPASCARVGSDLPRRDYDPRLIPAMTSHQCPWSGARAQLVRVLLSGSLLRLLAARASGSPYSCLAVGLLSAATPGLHSLAVEGT